MLPKSADMNKQKKPAVSLQDAFLEEVKRKRIQITIFFVNGYQMKGIVGHYDNFTILLLDNGKSNLLYKHSITTIAPTKPVELKEVLDQ